MAFCIFGNLSTLSLLNKALVERYSSPKYLYLQIFCNFCKIPFIVSGKSTFDTNSMFFYLPFLTYKNGKITDVYILLRVQCAVLHYAS
jgi:hypothetical protein